MRIQGSDSVGKIVLRRRKPLRWHIDYLLIHAEMRGALIIEASIEMECQLAAVLGKYYPRIAAGFGASDCGCGGHLFFAGNR